MYSGNEREAQVTQVGMEFAVGPETDAEINKLLGRDSGSFGGKLLRETDNAEWEESPSYCVDAALCMKILEGRSIVPFILQTLDQSPKKKRKHVFVTEYVAVFEMSDTIYATVPQPTEEAAAACVLWFVLGINHD
jgi:hypothetical protein